jgi:hypothetical protein
VNVASSTAPKRALEPLAPSLRTLYRKVRRRVGNQETIDGVALHTYYGTDLNAAFLDFRRFLEKNDTDLLAELSATEKHAQTRNILAQFLVNRAHAEA